MATSITKREKKFKVECNKVSRHNSLQEEIREKGHVKCEKCLEKKSWFLQQNIIRERKNKREIVLHIEIQSVSIAIYVRQF